MGRRRGLSHRVPFALIDQCKAMKTSTKLLFAMLGVAPAVAQASGTEYVYSNNSTPGDAFTVPGPAVGNQMITGFTGSSGEVATYRNTKNGAMVGINDTDPRTGNGSVHFSLNGVGVKSEVAIGGAFAPNGDWAAPLGTLDTLSSWGADLLTNSSNVSNLGVIMRLEIASATDNGGTYGNLVWDTTWAPGHAGTVTFGSWQTYDFFNNPTSTWLRGTGQLDALYGPGSITGDERTLADWMSILAGKGYYVLTANAGMGTFNGQFDGAMDNLKLGFGGNDKTYNFEVQAVPEPATMAALGLGALAMIRKRRQK